MRVYFHEAGLLEELRYRLQHPAALLIVLPNGLVKLINALPFICGDLRHTSARARSGRTSSARGTTRASRSSSTSSPRDPGARARCTNGSICDAPRRATAAPAGSARSACCASVAGALPLLPLRGPAALPARRGLGLRDRRTRSTRAIFWSGLAGVVLAVDRRRSLQRVFRRAHGHRPRLQSRRPAADVRRACSGSASPPSRARSPSASISRCACGWPILAFALLGGAGGDLLRGAADPLVVPRPGRARDRALLRAVDGAGQPLPAHAARCRGRRSPRRSCRAA